MKNKVTNKLFGMEQWNICFRRINPDDELPIQNKVNYKAIVGRANEWYADPFLFVSNGHTYCFCEIMNIWRNIGSIGVFELEEGMIKEIIKEPFHMSFPNVFEYKGDVYMIPETSQVKQIRLYKADIAEFPYKWNYIGNLVEGIDAVDSTVTFIEDDVYLHTYLDRERESRIYKIDISLLTAKQLTNIDMVELRPAGNPLIYKNEIIRPYQECSRIYGEKIHLYKENGKLTDAEYTLSHIGDIVASNLEINVKAKCTHTICRTDSYEVLDYVGNRFQLFKIPFVLKKRLFKK